VRWLGGCCPFPLATKKSHLWVGVSPVVDNASPTTEREVGELLIKVQVLGPQDRPTE
jgi:hypothetical protein